jgi:3-dehydroquinate synthase
MNRLDLDIQYRQPHRLFSVQGVLEGRNDVLVEAFGAESGGRVIAFVDEGLAVAQPNIVRQVRNRFAGDDRLPGLVDVVTVPAGEQAKNDLSVFDDLIHRIAAAGIDRHSYVLAVGGGAVLDAVGFAASVVHRGVRLVRLPSTTMAQADSAVGVKSGINLDGKKNMLGAFGVPWAVINDGHLLRTLSERDWRAGFSEAVKVALIKDARLFEEIEHVAPLIAERDEQAAWPIIEASARLHIRHIAEGGDPFEQGSARPLDMGHWSAHRLETMTDFRLRHGEAVATGLAIDSIYSGLCSLMSWEAVERVIGTLQGIGFALGDEALADTDGLMRGLDEFQEHLGGPLTLILPAGIGRTVTVNHVDRDRMLKAIRRVGALTSADTSTILR